MILSTVALLAFAMFPICMAYAAASDLVSMTIPNWIVLGLVAGFAVFAPLIGMDLSTFGWHWVAAGVVLLIGFACFSMGWMGGGDAKLAAAIALWLGPAQAVAFVGFSAALGGILTLVLLAYRRNVSPALVVRVNWLARLHEPKEGVPYGIALAAAALIIYPSTPWMALAVH